MVPGRASLVNGPLAVLAPLLVVALAYGLALLSNVLLSIGPLDRATFGWAVVVPTWAAAPIVAGIAWRARERRGDLALASGVILAAIVAISIGMDVVSADCTFGPSQTPIQWWFQSILLGGAVGGGFAFNLYVAAGRVQADHPWQALVVGAIGQVAVLLIGFMLSLTLFFGICQRP